MSQPSTPRRGVSPCVSEKAPGSDLQLQVGPRGLFFLVVFFPLHFRNFFVSLFRPHGGVPIDTYDAHPEQPTWHTLLATPRCVASVAQKRPPGPICVAGRAWGPFFLALFRRFYYLCPFCSGSGKYLAFIDAATVVANSFDATDAAPNTSHASCGFCPTHLRRCAISAPQKRPPSLICVVADQAWGPFFWPFWNFVYGTALSVVPSQRTRTATSLPYLAEAKPARASRRSGPRLTHLDIPWPQLCDVYLPTMVPPAVLLDRHWHHYPPWWPHPC